jgi:hypothetical protein
MLVDKVVTRYNYLQKIIFLATFILILPLSLPLKAYVQANKFMLAGTTSHWGADVSWFIQDANAVENFKLLMDRRENEELLKTLKRFNDAILFAIHPKVIEGDRIDPEIATFANEKQLTQLRARLADFQNCSFSQITLGSDQGPTNVVIVFIYGYPDNGVWPAEVAESCIERLRANFLP